MTVTYSVMFRPHGTGAFTQIGASTTNPTLNITGLTANTNYDFEVIAKDAGQQTTSPIISATTTNTVATIQVPLGIYINNNINTSDLSHWNTIKTVMGRTPAVIGAVGANTFGGYPAGSPPTQWDGGDSGPFSQILPVNGTLSPQLTWAFTDGTTDTNFLAYASAFTSTFSGQTYAHWIQNTIGSYAAIFNPKPTIYIRINWEFNQNFMNTGVTGVGSNTLKNWRNAWRGFANVAHSIPGIRVKIVWCPAASNDGATAPIGRVDHRQYYPAVAGTGLPYFGAAADAFNDGVNTGAVNGITHTVDGNGKFVDVIGPDIYAFGGGNPPTNIDATTTDFTQSYFTNYVKMAQDNSVPVAICELGDFSGTGDPNVGFQIAWQDWIPNHFIPYLNSLKTLSPPVGIEFLTLFDITEASAEVFSGNNQTSNNDLVAWRSCLGGTANGAPTAFIPFNPITTLPLAP